MCFLFQYHDLGDYYYLFLTVSYMYMMCLLNFSYMYKIYLDQIQPHYSSLLSSSLSFFFPVRPLQLSQVFCFCVRALELN